MKKLICLLIIVSLSLLSCGKGQVEEKSGTASAVKLTEDGVVVDNRQFLLTYAMGLRLLAEGVFFKEERDPKESKKIINMGNDIFENLFRKGTIISTDNGGFFFKTEDEDNIYFTMDHRRNKSHDDGFKARLAIAFKIKLSNKDVVATFNKMPVSTLSEESHMEAGLLTLEDFSKLKKFYGSIEIRDVLACRLLSIKN